MRRSIQRYYIEDCWIYGPQYTACKIFVVLGIYNFARDVLLCVSQSAAEVFKRTACVFALLTVLLKRGAHQKRIFTWYNLD